MKTIISAFAVLLVGISALPHTNKLSELDFSDQRLVTDVILSAIDDLTQTIKEAGLDPFSIDKEEYNYALPVPAILDASAYVEDLLFTGLSDIVVERINFEVFATRLTLTINLPALEATLGKAAAEALFFGSKYEAEVSGSLKITDARVATVVRLNLGIISGISIRSLSINFSLGGIKSDLNIAVQGVNYSNQVNTLLGDIIPNTLNEYSAEINELLQILALDIINDLL